MSLVQYDPAAVNFYCGAHKIDGYAKDTFLEVARNSPTYTTVVGAQGHAVAVKSADRSGYIQLTLLQTSKGNQTLSALMTSSELAPGGVAFPVTVRDTLGNTICFCAAALIEKPADVRYDTSIKERVWKFLCGVLLMNVGGNSEIAIGDGSEGIEGGN